MTNLELASQALVELIQENMNNTPLVDKAMIAFTAIKAFEHENDPETIKQINKMKTEQLTDEATTITDTASCNGQPKPTNSPTPNGSWSCTSDGWVWVPAT